MYENVYSCAFPGNFLFPPTKQLFKYTSQTCNKLIIIEIINGKGVCVVDKKQIEQQVIENYQKDENMMILVFAQWCVNNDLNPVEVYRRAYPSQLSNAALDEMVDLTVDKSEAGDIADETLLGVLSLFGNDDLAFVVREEIQKKAKKLGQN